MIRIFTRQIERLHAEDGQALIFVAMVGLVIFLFFALSMNVAELVNTKIKNQNVADATALSAAVWQARAMNLIAASNWNMMEFWALAIGTAGGCAAALIVCDTVCGEVWLSPLACIMCLVFSGATCTVSISSFLAAEATGDFQDTLLDIFDRNILEQDLPDVVDLNYAFKPNTASDLVGMYLYVNTTGDDMLRAYVPFDEEEFGEYVFERAGFCEALVSAARFANHYWHEHEGPAGVTDEAWQSFLPRIEEYYSEGGPCHNTISIPPLPGLTKAIFPLALRTRRSDWSVQNVETLLPISVATYKVQEPPPVLGKGSGPGECTWEENDTRFACPNARHYAFASAHAYSEATSAFYNTQLAATSTSYPVPYIPFVMDWQPRLFPFEPYPDGNESPYGGWMAYQDIARQIENEGGTQDHLILLNNVLMMNGRHFFLY